MFEELRRRMEEQGRSVAATAPRRRPSSSRRATRNGSSATSRPCKRWASASSPSARTPSRSTACRRSSSVADPVAFMRKVIDGLESASNSSSPLRLGEDMIAKTVCRHAVKANDPLRLPGGGETDQRSARVRSALLLSAWPADDDPDFARPSWRKSSAGKCSGGVSAGGEYAVAAGEISRATWPSQISPTEIWRRRSLPSSASRSGL